MIPGVKSARALSTMLQQHPVFSQFEIVNVAGDGDEDVKSEVIAGPADSDDDIPSFVRPRNLTYRAPQSAQDFMEELKKKN